MATKLQQRIRQVKPFVSRAEETYLNVLRTEAVLRDGLDRVFKPFGITGAQYNVLRILRGANLEGLCRNDIRERLISRMPDVTRLLDRMEEADLITRERDTRDRRMVRTQLTEKGRSIVDSLDEPIQAEHQRSLGHLTREQSSKLVELLTLARRGE